MDVKRESNKREVKEIYTVLFTAGTALLMACLKRAVMLMLIEQWRLWVFLVLNLVLLAIFFTSMHSISRDEQTLQGHGNVQSKKGYGGCEIVEDRSDNVKTERMRRHRQECVEVLEAQILTENEQEGVVEEDCEEGPRLSKEELNERAEAFIATFRQHLILDARKGRDINIHNRRGLINIEL